MSSRSWSPPHLTRTASILALALPALLALPIPSTTALAQEPQAQPDSEQMAMMDALRKAMIPGTAHAELAKQVGRWKTTTKYWPDPAGEPMITHGTAERTMTLGGRVLVEKVEAVVQGMPFEGVGRTGYDNVSGEYWSTWSDNMSTGLLMMHGSYDDQGVAVFKGETLDPLSGKPKKVRLVIRSEGPDKELNEYHEISPDGLMIKTMEVVYERQ